MRIRRILLALLVFQAVASAADLRPEIAVRDAIALQNEFSEPGKLPAKIWQPRQHTRWAAEGGVLHGRESTSEYQASRKDHQGFEPRLMIRNLPNDYVIEYRFRLNAGRYTPIGAFLEFGHHRARVSFHADRAELTFGSNNDLVVLDSKPGFSLELGRTYHVLGEVVGDEVVVQIEGGPVFRGRSPGIAEAKDGFGLCGLRGGTMDLDDVTVWSVKTPVPKSSSAVRPTR